MGRAIGRAEAPEHEPGEACIIDCANGPEFYIDGTTHVFNGPDVIHIICYVERHNGDRIERYEVVRLHMGREAYRRNLARAVERARMRERGH